MDKKILKNERILAVISKKAVLQNIKNIKKHVGDKKICAVVKDNAYGHLFTKLSNIILKYVDYFAVSTIDEALSFRKHFKKNNILILSHILSNRYEDAIRNNIELSVSSLSQAKTIDKVAKKLNKKSKIHIAINTGMNRIGFDISADNSQKTIKEISAIIKLKNIKVIGIFSHFSVADVYSEKAEYKNFTLMQKNRFDNFITELERNNINIPIKHIANSAGTILSLFENTDMVRPGIILYGVYPSTTIEKNIKINEILSLYSTITYIKTVKKDDYISYGNTYRATSDVKIATIGIGYGDGYPRALSNKQNVLINGVFCKIVGRVTMDQLMVDVSNVKCKIGDKVTLIGKDKNNFISIDELAKNSNMLNYEIMCNLNRRVPIIYK